MSDNGQVRVDPQRVIDRLLNRIAQLELDVAVKDAYIAFLADDRISAEEVDEKVE